MIPSRYLEIPASVYSSSDLCRIESAGTFTTALNFSGHALKQAPHLMHCSWTMVKTLVSDLWTAPTGQLRWQEPQASHFSWSMS
jgi:hypothetical protein